jgi:hypothetical protein
MCTFVFLYTVVRASVKQLFNGNLHVAFSSKIVSYFSGHVLFLFRLSEAIGTGAILGAYAWQRPR